MGRTWRAEQALRNRYPQCDFVGIDPKEENRAVVESIPRSRFFHKALHEKSGRFRASVLGQNGYYNQTEDHLAFSIALMQNANGHMIDFLTLDTEGGEFSLLKTLHSEFLILVDFSVICC